jgi:hydroxymethylbilane synthase
MTTELVIIKTEGDRITDRPLSAIGGRGVFVKAIEDALLAGDADLAVHSLKDMPSLLPDGLTLAAIPEREDARDVVVMPGEARPHSPAPSPNSGRGGASSTIGLPSPRIGRGAGGEGGSTTASDELREDGDLRILPHAARVGTSGPRRRAVLLHERPDLQVLDIRGNLDTRLRKLDAGEYDAIVLAAAGLRRLGLEARISHPLPIDLSVPAVGQGALAIEARAEDAALLARLALLDHAPTRACVTAERAALARLGGGCTLPFAAHATLTGDMLTLYGMAAATDGERLVRETLIGPATDPISLGTRLAEALLRTAI